MTIEWMQYPVSLGSEDETMTITWSDGSTDVVPAHDGDGETIFQLPRLMEEIFRVENFNCFVGQSGPFIDEYPALFRSETGVVVLRVDSPESFMNAFICKSKDAAECLLSWMRGDIKAWLEPHDYPPAGTNDFHWVSVREVLGFYGSGLLEDIAPIVFDTFEETLDDIEVSDELGLTKVDLPWWYPPAREGPAFGYPACLFISETYEREPTIQNLDSPSVAISVSQRLSEDEWRRLLEGCLPGSVADRLANSSQEHKKLFQMVANVAMNLGPLWINRWQNFK
jgi:hypothetical protein